VNNVAIRVENLWKRYQIGHKQEAYGTLRDAIASTLGAPLRVLRNRDRKGHPKEFWALQDISIEVNQGEVLGIIGRNGAGKSTLLKILGRVAYPSKGRAEISGRVGSLLEVGTGFHPELTGRENIYLNGAILGMKRREITWKFDEIVEFAEIEQFLDTPVKRYSSGMYLRLAFAVAAHLETDILLVDEVLAVGDAAFQKKCLGKIRAVATEGRTIVFVSHNMAAIHALCSSAIVLDRSRIICQGSPGRCISFYSDQYSQIHGSSWVRSQEGDSGSLVITQVNSSMRGEQPNQVLELDIEMNSRSKHKPAFLAVDILDVTGIAIMQALPKLESFIEHTRHHHKVRVEIDLPPLVPGQYLATVWVGSHNTETLDEVREVIGFEVFESPTLGRTYPHTVEHGYIVPHSSVRYD
jgi:lipopolysaccharide transport system ATP-binding protein